MNLKLISTSLALLMSCSYTVMASSPENNQPQAHAAAYRRQAPITLLEALERKHLPENKDNYQQLFLEGRRAQVNKDYHQALLAYSTAADYGNFVTFFALSQLYFEWAVHDSKNTQTYIKEAYKWGVWTLQEVVLQTNLHTHSIFQKCAKLLNDNKERLRKALPVKSKKDEQKNRKWNPDFTNPKILYQISAVKKLEPYLTKKEMEAKERFLKYWELSAQENNLVQHMSTLRTPLQKEQFITEMKRVRLPASYRALSSLYIDKGHFEEAALMAEKTLKDYERELDAMLAVRNYSLPVFYNYLARLGTWAGCYERFIDNDLGTPNYARAFEIYKKMIESVLKDYLNHSGLPLDTDLYTPLDDPIYHPFIVSYLKESLNPEMIRDLAKVLANSGVLFERGWGCEENQDKAFSLAALAHELCPSVQSYYNLGFYYLTSKGINYNETLAHDYLKIASDMGDGDAAYHLSRLYRVSKLKNLDEAHRLLRRGSEQGSILAKTGLAELLIDTGNVQEAQEILENLKNNLYTEGNDILACLYVLHLDRIEEGLHLAEKDLANSNLYNSTRMHIIRKTYNLINLYLHAKEVLETCDYDERIEDLKNIMRQHFAFDKNKINVLYYYEAKILFFEKNYEQALEKLHMAILNGVKKVEELHEDILKALDKQKKEDKQKRKEAKRLEEEKKKEKKLQKEETKRKLSIKKMRQRMESSFDSRQMSQAQDLEIDFYDQAVQEAFDSALGNPDYSKLQEIMASLKQRNVWEIKDSGKPEVLKNKFLGYQGAISFRINDFDRLVIAVMGPHKIKILSCQGHYDSKKRQ